ncbi:hypothetical protein FQN60_011631 [Etheostoma spectabile]|uniref:Uncharacterized protein n=1 Tax=Etheostoma spectabile TaxID=54343 RepID=A0A5J5DM39_9PERO|nr:hypothetical protein FQN60_011631 [Etheostoma spectabile]
MLAAMEDFGETFSTFAGCCADLRARLDRRSLFARRCQRMDFARPRCKTADRRRTEDPGHAATGDRATAKGDHYEPKETIRELTSKLSRCESQSLPAAGPGARRPGAKNTMGDVSRAHGHSGPVGQTLSTLKQGLENLEQYSRGNNTVQANSLKDLLQNKIDDMEKQFCPGSNR